MNKAVLDTDTLSAIMRQDSAAISNAQAYLPSYLELSAVQFVSETFFAPECKRRRPIRQQKGS